MFIPPFRAFHVRLLRLILQGKIGESGETGPKGFPVSWKKNASEDKRGELEHESRMRMFSEQTERSAFTVS